MPHICSYSAHRQKIDSATHRKMAWWRRAHVFSTETRELAANLSENYTVHCTAKCFRFCESSFNYAVFMCVCVCVLARVIRVSVPRRYDYHIFILAFSKNGGYRSLIDCLAGRFVCMRAPLHVDSSTTRTLLRCLHGSCCVFGWPKCSWSDSRSPHNTNHILNAPTHRCASASCIAQTI